MKNKLRYIVFLLFLLMFACNSFSINWKRINQCVERKQIKTLRGKAKYYKMELYGYRNHRNSNVILSYLNQVCSIPDTLYFVEMLPKTFDSIDDYTAFWVKGKNYTFMTYKSNGKEGKLMISRDVSECLYSFDLRKLCDEWNIKEIMNKSNREKKRMTFEGSYILLTRIVLRDKGKFNISCFFSENF